MKILIVGSNNRASLVIARSLGDANFELHNVYFKKKSITNYSRYISKSFQVNQLNNDLNKAKEKLIELIKLNKYNYILPVNDTANELLYSCFDVINSVSTILGPSKEVFEKSKDKSYMLKLCRSLDIPTPETEEITVGSFSTEIPFNYPIYLKPAYSSNISNGFLHNYNVRKVRDSKSLNSFLKDNNQYTSILAQKEVKGHGVGVNIISKKGEILAYTVHERIHEPFGGGGSSYRKSIELDPILLEFSFKICKALGYSGVLMIEFKKSYGHYYFMEVNSRFWGSLELSINSNVNFPLELIHLFEKGSISEFNYKANRYSRHLLKDIGWISKKLIRTKNPIHFVTWLNSFKPIFKGMESFDVEKLYDFKPAIFQVAHILRDFSSKLNNRIGVGLINFKAKQRKFTIEKESKILFVCKGNINRSAFAEYYLKDKGYKFVKSAGTIERKGRKCSSEIENIAKSNFSIDMSGHRSTYLLARDFLDSDIVFCFDHKNYHKIGKRFKKQMNKVYFLGANHIKNGQIEDPHNGQIEDYINISNQVAMILDSLSDRTC